MICLKHTLNDNSWLGEKWLFLVARIIVLAPVAIGDSVSNIFSANGWHTPPTCREVPLPWITYASIREINPPWDMVFVGGLTTNCAELFHTCSNLGAVVSVVVLPLQHSPTI
jgi:hypothetical protein